MALNQPSKYISLKGELLRKATHLGAFIIPGGYYILKLSTAAYLAIMIPITLCMILIDVSRLRRWRLWDLLGRIISPLLRESENQGTDFTGATYILFTACVTGALFSKPVTVAALCFIIFGDPASALIGRRYGRHKFKSKSLEGSLAFLAAATIVAFLAPGLPLWVTLTGAVVATVVEAVSYTVDDNVTVPLVSGLAMALLLKLFAAG